MKFSGAPYVRAQTLARVPLDCFDAVIVQQGGCDLSVAADAGPGGNLSDLVFHFGLVRLRRRGSFPA